MHFFHFLRKEYINFSMDSLKLLTFAEHIFECKQALLFALQGENSWKGGGGGLLDSHLTNAFFQSIVTIRYGNRPKGTLSLGTQPGGPS